MKKILLPALALSAMSARPPWRRVRRPAYNQTPSCESSYDTLLVSVTLSLAADPG